MAITSIGVYGVIVAGWASNSKYAFLGALRAAAQMVSYELAIGFVLVTVLLVSGTLNLSGIVNGQGAGWFAEKGINFMSWNRSEEHTSELQSLMRISYAVFCLKKNKQTNMSTNIHEN